MGSRNLSSILAVTLLLGCNGGASPDAPKDTAPSEPSAGETGSAEPVATGEDPAALLVRLLSWLPTDTLAVSFDRMPDRLDPAVVAAVFAIPPKAADLLDERRLLDESLAQAFETPDSDANPTAAWLGPESLTFSLPMIRHSYVIRPLLQPASELEATFVGAGFMPEELEGKVVWLPKGAFPWRMAILDEHTIAFVPADPGAGIQVLIDGQAAPASAVETQVADALAADPSISLTLLAGGPLLSFDTDAAIAQLQFALRRSADDNYEGLVVLMPDGDVVECAGQLRERSSPEENQQVQALIAAVDFLAEPTLAPPQVVGRLVIAPDQLKHFRP